MKHIGRRQLILDEIGSTNDFAAGLPADADLDGTVVRARCQTAGRGTLGRSWSSPAGAGVYLSIVLDPPAVLRSPAVLTAWATVSVAETVREKLGRQPRIKWPNDVLVGRKKICGILIEQKSHFIVGLGLNVNQATQDFGSAGLSDATSLALVAGRSFDVDEVAGRLLAQLDAEYATLLCGELAELEARWKWRVGLLGRAVSIELIDGTHLVGRLMDLTFAGAFLQTPAGSVAQVIPERIRGLKQVTEDSSGGSTRSSACKLP